MNQSCFTDTSHPQSMVENMQVHFSSSEKLFFNEREADADAVALRFTKSSNSSVILVFSSIPRKN